MSEKKVKKEVVIVPAERRKARTSVGRVLSSTADTVEHIAGGISNIAKSISALADEQGLGSVNAIISMSLNDTLLGMQKDMVVNAIETKADLIAIQAKYDISDNDWKNIMASTDPSNFRR